MNLTANFTLEEFTRSEAAARLGIENTPNEQEIKNLTRVAELLQALKVALGGKPIMINSGFRCKAVNDAVGSKDTSQHRLGCAADIRVPGMTPKMVVDQAIKADLPYDQIIIEYDSWTHISVPNEPTMKPRKQALVIDKTGTRSYGATLLTQSDNPPQTDTASQSPSDPVRVRPNSRDGVRGTKG